MCIYGTCMMSHHSGCSCGYCGGRDHGIGRKWSPEVYLNKRPTITGLTGITKTKVFKKIEYPIAKSERSSTETRIVTNFVLKPVLEHAVYQVAIAAAGTLAPPLIPVIVLANYAVTYGPSLYRFTKDIAEFAQNGKERHLDDAAVNAVNAISNKPVDWTVSSIINILKTRTEVGQSEKMNVGLNFVFDQIGSPIISNYTSNTVSHLAKVMFLPK